MHYELDRDEASSRAAHPSGQGNFPREFHVHGMNGVQARITPRLDFERGTFWLSIQSDSRSIPFDAGSIDDLIGVMETQIRQELGYRQHNFVFRGSTLSVFPLSRGSDQTRCVGIMLGGSTLHLDMEGVASLSAELRRVRDGLEVHASTRGMRPPSRQLHLAATSEA